MTITDDHHHYADLGGIRLHYVRMGAGEPLLLVHGWPGFWYEWHLNIERLAERFDVIVPDMRGYGYSSKPDAAPEAAYTDAHFAGDLLALADELGLGKLRIVSHDFGAIWMQKFARLRPDRMHRLMLFDPPYPGIGARWFQMPHVFNTWYQIFHQLPLAEQLVGASPAATEAYLRHFLSAWSHRKDLWNDEEIAEYVKAYSQPGALTGGFNCYRAALRGGAYTPGGTAKIATKTRVLWGTGDAILPFEWSDNLGQTFEDFDLRKIEDAGHFMMREAPDRVNAEIIEFMEG